MSTEGIKCHQCGKTLTVDHFTDEQLIADDDSRICIVCTNTNSTSKSTANNDKNKNKDKSENNDENKNKNKNPSNKVESEELDDNKDDNISSFATTDMKLYLNPDTNVWVPVEVIYVLTDGQTVIRQDLGNNTFVDKVISAVESNGLISFDQTLVGTSTGISDISKSVTFAAGSEVTENMAGVQTSVKTPARLSKYMQIYNELKANADANAVDDITLKQLARDECQYQDKLKSAQQSTTTTESTTIHQLMYNEMRVKAFSAKFPKTHNQYW